MIVGLVSMILASASNPIPDAEIATRVQAITPKLIETRRDIHAHPELANREYRTGKLVAARLRELEIEVRYPVAKTGVIGILRGSRQGRVVAVRADMDALPIEEKNEVDYKSRHPGVMHACGHDAHTAIVLGVAEVLSGYRDHLCGTVVFLFQPAEEGPPRGEKGGAALVLKEEAFVDLKASAILGLHVDPTLDFGKIGWSRGVIFASRDSFEIEITGRAAHGAYPEYGIDANLVAAEIVLTLDELGDNEEGTALTIGTIRGGDHAALVASRAVLAGTLRSLDNGHRLDLKERMERIVHKAAALRGAHAKILYIDDGVPPLVNDSSLTDAFVPILMRLLGEENVTQVEPQMGAEDFALYGEVIPAFYLRLGVRNEAKGITAPVHTDRFDIDEDAVPIGVRSLVAIVLEAMRWE